jgi:2-hydroxychromene-2-carboxylate isomerase
MKRVEFFFDLSSPYSYLASTQLPAICERNHAQLIYRPMVLGAVFKAAGNDMPARVPGKAKWMLRDLQRWAHEYNVPFVFSSHFPVNAIKAMRLILVDEHKTAEVTRAAFSAMWADNRNIAEPAELAAIAERGGLDPAHALAAIEEPALKDKLRANTDDAIARNAFGAPAIIVGEELFWGNDRLHFVEKALRE